MPILTVMSRFDYMGTATSARWPSRRASGRSLRAFWVSVGALGVLVALVLNSVSVAATSNIVVTATVLSATEITPGGCQSGVSDKTELGTVLPGSSKITGLDCTVLFGSSNDSSMLKLTQQDGQGKTQWGVPNGVLDASFSGDGLVEFDAGDAEGFQNVVVQPDGKIVAVGWMENPANQYGVARFNQDGTLDTTFDGPGGTGDGVVRINLPTANEYSNAVALQSDGKIILAGHSGGDVVVMRLNVDGSLDTNSDADPGVDFDTDGMAYFTGPAGSEYAYWTAVTPDGKILVSGRHSVGTNSRWYLARILPTGALDPTFDGDTGTADGYVLVEPPVPILGAAQEDTAALQEDGKIVIGGFNYDDTMYVVRLRADGTIDTGYGTNGVASSFFADTVDTITALAVTSDNKVVAGTSLWSGADQYRFGVVRFTEAGGIDNTFGGGDGWADVAPATLWNDGSPNALLPQPDGTVYAAGLIEPTGGAPYWEPGIVRLTEGGIEDDSFGNGGWSVPTFGASSDDQVNALTLGRDGALIGVGERDWWTDGFVLKYESTPVNDFVDNTNDWSVGTNAFGVCLHTMPTGGVNDWALAGSGNCTGLIDANWQGVATTTGGSTAKIAHTVGASTGITVNLRFGMRTSSNQHPGKYLAPMRFDVIAPAVP